LLYQVFGIFWFYQSKNWAVGKAKSNKYIFRADFDDFQALTPKAIIDSPSSHVQRRLTPDLRKFPSLAEAEADRSAYAYVDLNGSFRSSVLNASVLGVKGCFMAVGVRGGTFLISQAFSPEPSDVGEPSSRLLSCICYLRAGRCCLVGPIDQMPHARLIVKAALTALLVCYRSKTDTQVTLTT
jgi:hypothetical protein